MGIDAAANNTQRAVERERLIALHRRAAEKAQYQLELLQRGTHPEAMHPHDWAEMRRDYLDTIALLRDLHLSTISLLESEAANVSSYSRCSDPFAD